MTPSAFRRLRVLGPTVNPSDAEDEVRSTASLILSKGELLEELGMFRVRTSVSPRLAETELTLLGLTAVCFFLLIP